MTKDVWKKEHPYSKYPRRFRIFFNNFMMSRPKDLPHYIHGMNWQRDIRLYKLDRLIKKFNLQLPSYDMARKIYEDYGYAPED